MNTNELVECKHCFDEKPLLVDYSKDYYCDCDHFDDIYCDEAYLYKGKVCPQCGQLWAILVVRETVYDGNVREIYYAKFTVEQFESYSKKDWDTKCVDIFREQNEYWKAKFVNKKSAASINRGLFGILGEEEKE
ncbi:MAG TPA: hypothetical protein PKW37_10155 [Salinivirgaceae bacterium]|nr:hypothetical protein [Salinivirgaceae bacterium]